MVFEIYNDNINLIVILGAIFIFVALYYLITGHGDTMFLAGFTCGQSIFKGVPIKLDKDWLGTTFFPTCVFKQVIPSGSEPVHLLEAANELEQKPRLFIITETEYHQLLIEDGIVLGKEYIYTSRVSHPGADVYYFKRQVGMHSE